MARVVPKKKLFDKVSERTIKIASFISAILAIIGAITGAFSWVSGQFANAVSGQISEFREEVKESNDRQDLAIMRLELMNLIQSDPENVVEIERLAKKYFSAGGNSYISKYFSAWTKEYGGDASIVIGDK